jgi:formate dehydrogenase subunit delta
MNIDHLIHMINQIAANLAAQGEETAVAETAQHIVDFWDPRMKAGLFAADLAPLSPIARAAVDRLVAAHT